MLWGNFNIKTKLRGVGDERKFKENYIKNGKDTEGINWLDNCIF